MPITKLQRETCLFWLNDLPEMLEYTKQAHTTIMEGTPYEQSYDNYNTSLEGGKFALKGTDGLKTGSSPTADYNYTATTKRGKQRIIEVILGVGNYDVEIAESYRNQIGNTLAEKMFADYQYKKILSAGDHTIDGKTIHLKQDFYATVKKGTKPTLKLEDNRLVVQNREWPSVSLKQRPLAVKARDSMLCGSSASCLPEFYT